MNTYGIYCFFNAKEGGAYDIQKRKLSKRDISLTWTASALGYSLKRAGNDFDVKIIIAHGIDLVELKAMDTKVEMQLIFLEPFKWGLAKETRAEEKQKGAGEEGEATEGEINNLCQIDENML